MYTSLDLGHEPPCFGIWQMASLVKDMVSDKGEVNGLSTAYTDVFFLDKKSVQQCQEAHTSCVAYQMCVCPETMTSDGRLYLEQVRVCNSHSVEICQNESATLLGSTFLTDE